jgi:hypothetical protein
VIYPLEAPGFKMIEFKSSKQKALKFFHRKAMVANASKVYFLFDNCITGHFSGNE